MRKFVNGGPGVSLVVCSLDRHLSALELVALPSRIRKPPGMPTNRVTQLQQDGIRLAKRLPRLTQCFFWLFKHGKRTWARLQSEEEPPCAADLGQFQAVWNIFLLVPDLSQLKALFQVWHELAGLESGRNDNRWLVHRCLPCQDSNAHTFAHAKVETRWQELAQVRQSGAWAQFGCFQS